MTALASRSDIGITLGIIVGIGVVMVVRINNAMEALTMQLAVFQTARLLG